MTDHSGEIRAVTEDRLREVLAADGRWFGDWDAWTRDPRSGYNALTVSARAALAHLHGRHENDGTPFAYCVLCSTFRVSAEASLSGREGRSDD